MSKPSIKDFMKSEPVQAVAEKPVKQGEQIINMTFRLPQSRWKKLADLSTDQRKPIQQILVTAVEAEFEKLGLPF